MKISIKLIVTSVVLLSVGLVGGKILSSHHIKTEKKGQLIGQKEKPINWEKVSG